MRYRIVIVGNDVWQSETTVKADDWREAELKALELKELQSKLTIEFLDIHTIHRLD
jgi:hypothetical protein